jgi:hypothetical protein
MILAFANPLLVLNKIIVNVSSCPCSIHCAVQRVGRESAAIRLFVLPNQAKLIWPTHAEMKRSEQNEIVKRAFEYFESTNKRTQRKQYRYLVISLVLLAIYKHTGRGNDR